MVEVLAAMVDEVLCPVVALVYVLAERLPVLVVVLVLVLAVVVVQVW